MATLEMPVISAELETLRDSISGSVLTAGDAAYDQARMGFNLNFLPQPALIVVAQNARDVAEAVRYARAAGLGIAVQATGHGTSRLADGALLINMAQMNHATVDAARQTAYIEGGAKWQAVLPAAVEAGLAPLLGSSPEVGAVGYTLGGGFGWLARKYGMSSDSVLWFDVVTADGQLIRASASEHSDLFWALRGGGGSFGIVVGMQIKLYPVATLHAGNLYYPAEMAKEVFLRYREWIKHAPDELTSSIALFNYPPFPQVPEPLRGKSFVQVRGAYAGAPEDGAALLKYWLDWQQPALNMWGTMPFSMVETISNDPKDPSPAAVSGAWMRELTDEAIDTLINRVLPQDGPPALIFAELRHAGGAIARVDKHASAYSNRDAQHLLEMVAFSPTPEAYTAVTAYQMQLKRELAPALTGGQYLNFLEGEEKWAKTAGAYLPENYLRLQAIKAQYDPQNVFCFSFNIPPQQRAR